jgi:hypothetical protein
MARLVRDRDGEGHYGCCVDAYEVVDGKLGNIVGHEPIVGCCLKVGTITAGMFSARDWWMTTQITEIISEDDEKVIFKTANSTYTLFK